MKVSVILPIMLNHAWQKHLTDACIKIMRCTTKVEFDLIIVETISDYYRGDNKVCDFYIRNPQKRSYTEDFNEAIDKASGDIIVQMANDIFVQDGWLEALLECFKIADCGAATLSSIEMKQPKVDKIMESITCPVLMAWKKELKYTNNGHIENMRFDEDFPDTVSDTDLIMRIYEAGYRMYRNYSVQYYHLVRATFGGIQTDMECKERGEKYINLFKQKHKNSPLMILRALTEGWLV